MTIHEDVGVKFRSSTDMTNRGDLVQQFVNRLEDFEHCASAVWMSYQLAGPGAVDQTLFAPVETAAAALDRLLDHREQSSHTDETIQAVTGAVAFDLGSDWARELLEVVRKTHALAYRCACRPEGLCFVSGETGLIPRNDEHAAFEGALAYISDLRARLTGCQPDDESDPRHSGGT